jgi:hypothetical protein
MYSINTVQYKDSVVFGNALKPLTLAPFARLRYNKGNRPSCNLGGGKHRQSANHRNHATALGKEPCRAPGWSLRMALYRPDVEETPRS